MLTRLHELQAAEAELAAHSAALAGAQQALHSMAAAAKEHAKYERTQAFLCTVTGIWVPSCM